MFVSIAYSLGEKNLNSNVEIDDRWLSELNPNLLYYWTSILRGNICDAGDPAHMIFDENYYPTTQKSSICKFY
jgi:hypothetical protein